MDQGPPPLLHPHPAEVNVDKPFAFFGQVKEGCVRQAPLQVNPSPSWCAGLWLASGWRPPARGGTVDKLYDARRSAIRSKYRGHIGAKNMRSPTSVITLGFPKP